MRVETTGETEMQTIEEAKAHCRYVAQGIVDVE